MYLSIHLTLTLTQDAGAEGSEVLAGRRLSKRGTPFWESYLSIFYIYIYLSLYEPESYPHPGGGCGLFRYLSIFLYLYLSVYLSIYLGLTRSIYLSSNLNLTLTRSRVRWVPRCTLGAGCPKRGLRSGSPGRYLSIYLSVYLSFFLSFNLNRILTQEATAAEGSKPARVNPRSGT